MAEWCDDLWILSDWDQNGRSLIELLSCNLPEGTRLWLEPGGFRIQFWKFSATPDCLVMSCDGREEQESKKNKEQGRYR